MSSKASVTDSMESRTRERVTEYYRKWVRINSLLAISFFVARLLIPNISSGWGWYAGNFVLFCMGYFSYYAIRGIARNRIIFAVGLCIGVVIINELIRWLIY